MNEKLTDDQLQAAYRQQVMHDLAEDEGLMPVYRADIRSPEDFAARAGEMPLIAVWGEAMVEGRLCFSISVNARLVRQGVELYMHADDPWLEPTVDHIVADLSALTQSSLLRTMEQTGMGASEVCRSLG